MEKIIIKVINLSLKREKKAKETGKGFRKVVYIGNVMYEHNNLNLVDLHNHMLDHLYTIFGFDYDMDKELLRIIRENIKYV